MDVFDLVAKLSLDKTEYESGLTEAKSNGTSFGSALATAGKTAVAGIAAVGTAVAGLGVGFASATSSLAEYGDNIDKSSQKLGVSAQFYQEWEAVLEHSGTSMDSMGTAFKKLATASQDATDDQVAAFEKLGLGMEQVSAMSSEELFTSVISGLQGMGESTERTALATTLLGKGAMEMGALLNTSAEDTQAMIDTVNQLGGVLDDSAVKESAKFQDNLQDLTTAFDGLKNKMLSDFLPSINTVTDGLIALMSGDDSGLGQVNKGIDDFVANLTENLPKIFEVGGSIMSGLADAIIENLPQIIDAGANVVMELAQGLIENLSEIVEVGLEVIVELAKGIGDSLPELIPTIVDVVLEITETLIDNVDLLIDGAVALIVGLAEGLINALPKLIEKAPEIVIKLMNALIENAPKLLDASLKLIVTLAEGLGKSLPELLTTIPSLVIQMAEKFLEMKSEFVDIGINFVKGLGEGISNAWDSFVENVIGKAKDLINDVKGVFGIHSPSKVFSYIGEMCVTGLQDGSDGLFSGEGITANVNADVESTGKCGIDYDELGNSVARALAGFSINMDGRSVAQLTAGYMDAQLGVLNARRV